MDISSDSDWEKLSKWETLSAPLLARFVCDKGSLVAVGVITKLTDGKVIISLDKGRLEISLVGVIFDEGSPTIIPSPRLASPVLDRLIIRFPGGGFCDLSEMPVEREEWPSLLSEIIQ